MRLFIPLTVVAIANPLAAQTDSGFDPVRLELIDSVFQNHVNDGRIAGALGMVIRNNRVVYQDKWGMRDRDLGDALEYDDIFQIYSMTKPIVSVGLMMLFEEGRFRLTDPVGRYLPELRRLEVADLEGNPSPDEMTTMRANRAVTIQDLLRHTSGLTYGLFSNTAVDQLYRQANLFNGTTADMVEKLGELPLLVQPGSRWVYSVSTDVVGRLIEVLSGQPLDEYLQQRIFDPLRMVDTGFYVPANRRDRLARMYGHGPDGVLTVQDDSRALTPPTFLGGGGGLMGTAPDYARFARMLLNGGVLDGARLLSPSTVELMTTDHLGDVQGPGQGWGFGLGFAVREVAGLDGTAGSVGEYYWAGLAGTGFWVDPVNDLIGIFMVHILPNRDIEFRAQFRTLVYQALVN